MYKRIMFTVSLFLCTSSCNSSVHQGLEGREVGAMYQYRQTQVPTESQKSDGEGALKRWKNASTNNKYFLADKIVLGQVLIGKTKKEVDDTLGEIEILTNESSQYMLVSPMMAQESSAALVAKYGADGKVNSCYIDVNR